MTYRPDNPYKPEGRRTINSAFFDLADYLLELEAKAWEKGYQACGDGQMSKWLNTTIVRHPELEKPCGKLDYCPYGQLVEEFPLSSAGNPLSCLTSNGAIIPFGHDCPVHYHAETPIDCLVPEE